MSNNNNEAPTGFTISDRRSSMLAQQTFDSVAEEIKKLPEIRSAADVPAGAFVIDSIGAAASVPMAGKSVPPTAESKTLIDNYEIPGIERLSDIPELRACVELMQEEMQKVRGNSGLAPFIKKQKLKVLQLDYARLGGRLRALVKLLSRLEEHPDYEELQDDMRDCVIAAGKLIGEIEKKHRFDIAARCRALAPLTPEQEADRDRYEDAVLAERSAAQEKADVDELAAELQNLVPETMAEYFKEQENRSEEVVTEPQEPNFFDHVFENPEDLRKPLDPYVTGENSDPNDLSE